MRLVARGTAFETSEAAFAQCGLLKRLLEDVEGCGDIPVDLEPCAMERVLHFIEHGSVPPGLAFRELNELCHAANYLDMPALQDAVAAAAAERVENKSIEELRAMLGVEDDFTAEEMEHIRRIADWVF